MPRNLGRFDHTTIEWINTTTATRPELSRHQLAVETCQRLGWQTGRGVPATASCSLALRKLEKYGLIKLPRPRITRRNNSAGKEQPVQPYHRPVFNGTIQDLGRVKFIMVNGDRDKRFLWESLMNSFHPHGSGPLCGARIQYIIESDQGILGATGFSSAAYRLRDRDRWIGWEDHARDCHLGQVINNSRFLILPQVRVPNLASFLLARSVKTVCHDWQEIYGQRPVLVETFVDPAHHRGTCYLAANWQRIGRTSGRGRRDNNDDLAPKEIFALPLTADWRGRLGGREPSPPRDWIEAELANSGLGDKRLHRRAIRLCREFYANPQALLPQACKGEAALKGAYRFFRNQRVDMASILQGHYQATTERIRRHRGVVLAVQDTTSLNYNAIRSAQGLGPIDAKKTQGLLVHDTMAFTDQGVPLGLIDVQAWARVKKESRKVPESIKWLHSFGAAGTLQQACPNKKIVSVGDREADYYQLFLEAQQPASPDLLVRVQHARPLVDSEENLWTHMADCPLAGTQEVRVPAKAGRKARVARLEIRFDQVALAPPKSQAKNGPVTLWAVSARERKKPARGKRLEWLLLTTVAVNSFEEACERLNWYGVRWGIEVYHRTLKSGCRIEDRLLRHGDAIKSCLALDMIVAWRVYFLTKQGRETPDWSCTELLEEAEWKALTAYVDNAGSPADYPPTLGEAMVMIARLGGYMPRSSKGPPGTTTTWRGLVALGWLSGAWKAFGQPPPKPG
ncbi:MAG TPA: IS4 family transposase [Desulfobulbaceae bacterium]|nr:IS4 family transposase [Desulfobulbaceae bacterium]